MKQNKIYPHELKEKGFVRANWKEITKCQLEKSAYVEMFLSPAVAESHCGWYGVQYVVFTNGEEYVFFLAFDKSLSRGVCVTGNSKVAIATAVFDNID